MADQSNGPDPEFAPMMTFPFLMKKAVLDDITKIVAEMNYAHDRDMALLWERTDRYRRQRNMLAITLGVIVAKTFMEVRRNWGKPAEERM